MRIDPDDRITVYVLGVALSSSMRSVDCRSGIINPFVVLGREQPSLSAYLTLPSGEDVLPPSAEASNGPNAHPRINYKVTKSPSVVLT